MNPAQAKQIALDIVLRPAWRADISNGVRCPEHPWVVYGYFGTTKQSCGECDLAIMWTPDLSPVLVRRMDALIYDGNTGFQSLRR